MTYREETIGACRLILGDMREHMSPVDHVISDPPYEDELHGAIGRIRRNDGRAMCQDLGFGGVNEARAEYARVVCGASRGWVILFTLAEGVRAWRDDMQAVGAKWDTTLAWVKPDASPRFNGQGAARGFECAVTAWCGKGYRSWNGGGRRGVFTHCCNTEREGVHPTEKPVRLMMELVSLYTQHGQLVADPFMGSGTTGVACARLGRSFLGIEQDEKHFATACRRVEQAYRQADLFITQPEAAA